MYLFLYPEMDFQSHFYVFYQVKQNREKKHKMQGFIQMYNGAFLHNMGRKSQSRPFSIECGKGIFDKYHSTLEIGPFQVMLFLF